MIGKNATKRILIVEDDASTNQLMRKTLEKSGYEVVVSPDGRAAMKVLGAEKFDAILLDLMMPERDGFELCRLIRINPTHENVAIIMMSGLRDLATVQRAMACGANDYITKPWVSEEVIIRIANAIRLADIESALVETQRTVSSALAARKSDAEELVALKKEIYGLKRGLEVAARGTDETPSEKGGGKVLAR